MSSIIFCTLNSFFQNILHFFLLSAFLFSLCFFILHLFFKGKGLCSTMCCKQKPAKKSSLNIKRKMDIRLYGQTPCLEGCPLIKYGMITQITSPVILVNSLKLFFPRLQI